MNSLYFIKETTISQTACNLTDSPISCKVDRLYRNMNCNRNEAKNFNRTLIIAFVMLMFFAFNINIAKAQIVTEDLIIASGLLTKLIFRKEQKKMLSFYHVFTAKTYNEMGEPYPVSFTKKKIIGEPGICRRDPSDVIKLGDKYYFWYTKVVKADLDYPKAEHYPSGYPGDIWYATSPDGKQWTEQGEAIHKGRRNDFDEHGIFTPNILIAKGKYYLFYTAVREPYVWERTPTAIGVAVAESPDGPWKKYENNPVLMPSRLPDKFDSFRCDDTCFIVREGKYWMYYKGRPIHGKTQMGVAIAMNPTGPYMKYKDAKILHRGHEVLVWPSNGGVASLAVAGRRGIYFAKDGLNFKFVKELKGIGAPGLYRSDRFEEKVDLSPIEWGIDHGKEQEGLALYRFDCVYSQQNKTE